jgi:hypothetical protein
MITAVHALSPEHHSCHSAAIGFRYKDRLIVPVSQFHMIRGLLVPVMLLSCAASALAQAPPPPAMRFEWVREGPADKCADHCREWISARGAIIPNTPRIFVEFMQAREVRGATIVLESEGGSLAASMALGRLFRRFAMTTTVGHTAKLADGSDRATLSPSALCISACTYALLGGQRRHVPAEARVMVHQVWPFLKREDAVGATYTAQDLVVLQRELGILAKYIVDMGADIELFEIAERIPPWENPRPLSADDLRRLRVSTVDDPFAPAPATGDVSAVQAAPVRPLDVVDRAWIMTEGTGQRGFSRRHPLTVEGEQIGSFELTFACAKDGELTVAYNETRRLRDGVNERLSGVAVGSGKERVLLQVQSSAPDMSGELRSAAQASVPPALLTALAETEGRALVVVTQTLSNIRTLIRPGNTGFGESLRRTVTDCKK